MTVWSFFVPGPVVGKQRARVTARGTFTPARTLAAEKLTRETALLEQPAGWPLDASYKLELTAYYHDKRRRDLDNILKLVSDSLNKVAYLDDSQIVEIHAHKSFSKVRPGVLVVLSLACDSY